MYTQPSVFDGVREPKDKRSKEQARHMGGHWGWGHGRPPKHAAAWAEVWGCRRSHSFQQGGIPTHTGADAGESLEYTKRKRNPIVGLYQHHFIFIYWEHCFGNLEYSTGRIPWDHYREKLEFAGEESRCRAAPSRTLAAGADRINPECRSAFSVHLPAWSATFLSWLVLVTFSHLPGHCSPGIVFSNLLPDVSRSEF